MQIKRDKKRKEGRPKTHTSAIWQGEVPPKLPNWRLQSHFRSCPTSTWKLHVSCQCIRTSVSSLGAPTWLFLVILATLTIGGFFSFWRASLSSSTLYSSSWGITNPTNTMAPRMSNKTLHTRLLSIYCTILNGQFLTGGGSNLREMAFPHSDSLCCWTKSVSIFHRRLRFSAVLSSPAFRTCKRALPPCSFPTSP